MKDVVAGIDIGGTNIIFGLVDKSGNVIAEDRLKTVEYPDIKDYISAQHAAINKMLGDEFRLQADRSGSRCSECQLPQGDNRAGAQPCLERHSSACRDAEGKG